MSTSTTASTQRLPKSLVSAKRRTPQDVVVGTGRTQADRVLRIADLFCGAGGTSTGAVWAAERLGYKVDLTLINHWQVAIDTIALNHPGSRVLCTSINDVDPYSLYKPGELDILLASPECVEHSYAKGGRAVNDQRRVTAWCVIRWMEALLPPVVWVENVLPFENWGPIDSKGKPIKKRRGDIFKAWVNTAKALGYKAGWKRMKCDRYGTPTTRTRLIIQFVRGNRRIVWPEETHAPASEVEALRQKQNLFTLQLKPSVPARDIIDWSLEGRWLDEMPEKKQYGGLPLSPKTLRRIFAGFEQHGMKPFVLTGQNGRTAHQKARVNSIDEPLPTVVSEGHHNLVEPFVIGIDNTGGNGNCVWPLDRPLSTITSKARHAVVEPFIVELRGTDPKQLDASGKSIHEPLGTITAGGGHNALVEPFIVQCTHGESGDPNAGNRRTRSVNDPLPTICGRGDFALLQPFIIPQLSGGAPRPVSDPMPTVTCTSRGIALVQPYIIKFYGSGGSASIDAPLPTCTGNDRFALLCPKIEINGVEARVRFRFRMFQDHELALAQGFPKEYRFSGNKSERVKQIGNAVPPTLADAYISAQLKAERRPAA
jgi:DNA (cytosine-5)-methyltransferase 1